MSLILSWDHPLHLTELPHRAVISRGATVIATDAPWGVFEDPENDRETELYSITYTTRSGANVGTVSDADIKRYKRPADTARVEFSFSLPDGSPAAGRVIEITDEPTATSMTRRVTLNSHGDGYAIVKHGVRLLFRYEGAFKALDAVIPAIQSLTYDELRPHGTWIDSDRRGWY